MPIIATPEGASELTQLRTLCGKVFQLPDGKRRLITKLGRVHYHNDANQLDDIDTTPEQEEGTGEWVANRLPYRFRLRTTGIGFDYQSREDGGIVRKALTRVGVTAINQATAFTPEITGNRIRYVNVVNGLDVVFVIGRTGVNTYWIPKTSAAPKTVRWAMEYDGGELGKPRISSNIDGFDNLLNEARVGPNRRSLNVSLQDGTHTLQGTGRYRFLRDETWTGETKVIDPVTRIASWSTDVIYPVAVDPSITEEVAADAADGTESYSSSWSYTQNYIYVGSGTTKRCGWRFTTIPIDQGSTINSATLRVRVRGSAGSGFASATIWGAAANDTSAWSSSNRPSQQSKTSASVSFTRPSGTGLVDTSVTTIIQEIVNRAGWANNNNLSLFMDNGESSRQTNFEDFHDSGTDEGTLIVDYTAGGKGPSFRRRSTRFFRSSR